MERQLILERVRGVASECFACAPEDLREVTVAADVERWDSLRHLVFVSSLEQEFGVEFDMEVIGGLTDVGALVTEIARLTK